MLTSIDVKFIFNCLFIGNFRRKRVVQFCKYSPNSRCRPPSCIINVVAIAKRVKCSAILYSLPKTTQPRPQVFSVNCPVFWQLCCKIDVIFQTSHTSSKFGQL